MRGALLLALALAACSPAAQQAPAGERIWCALGGAKTFAQDCTVERAGGGFVVHHPDGSFRRLVPSADGQHLDAADGADAAQSALKQDRYEVILGDARYVIPRR